MPEELKKPEDFPELLVPDTVRGIEGIHPGKLRRFMSHLSVAAIKAEDRSMKKTQVKERIDKIRTVALNKRSTKNMIEDELGDFESVIHELIHDEQKILDEQRKETRQINELKMMVETLSRKLIGVGRDYASELEEKDSKILELREALSSANIKISESGEERKQKIKEIERKIKQSPKPGMMSAVSTVAALEDHLDSLEQKHAELKESGNHSKKDLDRVKKLIDKHKDTIQKAKAKI
ncbi:MAG: hypothetical protein ABIA62_08105 [Candidatus Woesearchaeota archaeon]